jgi:hypothetical protein|nr:hypothetical protein [uncultured Mucilaginibacter sp.]
MKTTLSTIKNDLYRVFVKGDADTTQLAHVFMLLALPAITSMFALGRLPIY